MLATGPQIQGRVYGLPYSVSAARATDGGWQSARPCCDESNRGRWSSFRQFRRVSSHDLGAFDCEPRLDVCAFRFAPKFATYEANLAPK